MKSWIGSLLIGIVLSLFAAPVAGAFASEKPVATQDGGGKGKKRGHKKHGKKHGKHGKKHGKKKGASGNHRKHHRK